MTIDPDVATARSKIAEAAREMLSGRLSFLEGARIIVRFNALAGLANSDPDIVPFVTISSQTGALPLGETRKLWEPAALAKIQPQIEQAEKWAAEHATPHCRALIARFGANAGR